MPRTATTIALRDREFDLADMGPQHIRITDIARSLSRLPRYLGHTEIPVNVAVHSCLVSRALEKHGPRIALLGLLHDAHEAYMGDITSPVKNLIGAAIVEFHARRIDGVIYAACNMPAPSVGEAFAIREADEAALASEWIKGGMNGAPPTSQPPAPLAWSFANPDLAEGRFLERFRKLAVMVPGVREPA